MQVNDRILGLAELVDRPGFVAGDDLAGREPGLFVDEFLADAVLRPTSTGQVAAILRYCNEQRIAVVPQGGMTGLVRGTQTGRGNIVLSLERMNEIEYIDPVSRTARVQAGAVLQKLQEKVAAHDLDFPLDLGARGSCQVGGNAATNAGGLRVVRYGMMRELVLGLEAVLADGTVVSSMNEMMKNNTGYDLKQLFIGSEGTLGVITKLVLRLYEAPKSRNTALAALASFEQVTALLKHVDRCLAGQMSSFEVMWDSWYSFITAKLGNHPLEPGYPYYAIFESLGGDPVRDQDLFQAMLESAAQEGLLEDAVVATSEKDARRLWEVREHVDPVLSRLTFAYDVSLPIRHMEGYIRGIEDDMRRQLPGSVTVCFGHLADGNLHFLVLHDGEPGDDIAEAHAISDAVVYGPLANLGGSVSAEHGIGLEKKAFLHVSRDSLEIDVMKRLKHVLDPNDILNPGKIF
ncbi:MAG: FAD-binding oxidoreductase [Gammaproteobacteria bacterium]|nr:FAD-binding oxidoreductase [Gammaproteobacteria bacterium]